MNAPEGWKLVPLEPTREMLQAVHDGPLGADEHTMTAEVEQYLIDSYKAAINAAPTYGVEGTPAPDAMQALKAALPVLQDYASSNPMHFYRGEWHDPRGVHAAVKLVTAALGVGGNDGR